MVDCGTVGRFRSLLEHPLKSGMVRGLLGLLSVHSRLDGSKTMNLRMKKKSLSNLRVWRVRGE
jgi:hypothetical protein